MIQALAQSRRLATRRRLAAVLLALVLNVALVPCTMAIEVVEDGHDCCPPELRLDAADCCEVDDASIDARGAVFEPDDLDESVVAASYPSLDIRPAARACSASDPPDPPERRVDRNALYCTYLK